MRIAVLFPRRPRWAKMRWVVQALRNLGHETLPCHDLATLRQAGERCDLAVLEHKNAGCNRTDLAAWLRNRPCRAVQWWFDLVALEDKPLAEQAYVKSFGNIMRACDTVYVKERGLLDEYRDLGINAKWLPQGCPSDMPAVTPQPREWDVLVWGQPWKQRKVDVRRLVKAGFSVAWASHNGIVPEGVERLVWTPPFELPALASRAGCVLSCDLRNDLDGYWSDRLELAGGMGAPVLRRWSPGLPSWVKTYTDDVAYAARGLLEQPYSARDEVMREQTYEARLTEVLD